MREKGKDQIDGITNYIYIENFPTLATPSYTDLEQQTPTLPSLRPIQQEVLASIKFFPLLAISVPPIKPCPKLSPSIQFTPNPSLSICLTSTWTRFLSSIGLTTLSRSQKVSILALNKSPMCLWQSKWPPKISSHLWPTPSRDSQVGGCWPWKTASSVRVHPAESLPGVGLLATPPSPRLMEVWSPQSLGSNYRLTRSRMSLWCLSSGWLCLVWRLVPPNLVSNLVTSHHQGVPGVEER